MSFVAATYNIHACVGCDGRKDPERTSEVLQRLAFDVIGLQEVESQGEPGTDSHQLDFLSRRTECRAVAGSTLKRGEADYGNALLTRAPILDVARHDLSVAGREPRGALEVRLEIRSTPVRVVVTHLGLAPAERRFQVKRLLGLLANDGISTLLLGDFNEWFPWARSRRQLRRHLGDIPMPATFPARRPIFALDHTWARPRSSLSRVEAFADPLARVASDHLPVRARVALGR